MLRGPEREHNKHAVSVYSKKTDQIMNVIGHNPDSLAKVVHGLMSEWMVFQLILKIDQKYTSAPEGT